MRRSSLSYLAFTIALLLQLHIIYATDYPTCGNCWCIASEECPCPDWEPVSDYPKSTVKALEKQIPDFIYTIDCNPYQDENCETVPPREYVELGDEAVCGINYGMGYHVLDNLEHCSIQYSMKSYPSWTAAENDGAFVTHTGSCGVCSTTEDLAGYINNPDLEEDSIKCVVKGLASYEEGVECFMKAGLTEECSKMWLYDGYHTTKECTEICVAEVIEKGGDVPGNGPPPECELSDCLQCDEDESGPIFKEYVGRIRRNSGLLSNIVRECCEVPQIIHDPCPNLSSVIDTQYLRDQIM